MKEAPTPHVLLIQQGGYNPLSFPRFVSLKYKCRPPVTTRITATFSVTSIVTSTCHCIQSFLHFTVNDTQPDLLTWIIYQGHLSTISPASPTHASTKHVPRSPTYHHNICVSTMYQIMCHTKHQLCTTHCTTISASTMHQNLYKTMHQPCTISCIKHVPHQVHQLCTIPSTSTMYRIIHQPCTIS
jgi:hypothetical protein